MKLKKVLVVSSPFLIATASTLVCTLIAMGSVTWLGRPVGFIIFLPAVLVSSWYGGLRAGICAALLSSIAIYYISLPPSFSVTGKSYVNIAQLFLYILEGIFISWVIDHDHRHEKISHFEKLVKDQKKTIGEMKDQLERSKREIASRDEFLSIASHELKTPLTTVLLQIQTTLHSIRNVSLAQFSVANLLNMLQSAEVQTKRLSKMINDLLNISLLTTHRLTLEPEKMDLTLLVKEAVENFMPKYEHEGTYLAFSATESIVGKWDKLRLEQAVDNLLSNALKYGNKKPVHVLLKKEGNNAILAIADAGIGIGDEEKEKIFALFTRGEATERDYKGLGIGLFISREIIVLSGGTIEVMSKHGKGTTFTITLPIFTP